MPDGTTDTTTSIDDLNRLVVDISDSNRDRISHNKYSEFNVGSNGVILNNTGAAARTIINEVTGSNPSLINGELRVLGTRAHVVIANPNGVSVNGASFVNMGSVALTTGRITYESRNNSIGTQSNPVITTGSGKITIGELGLSGVMNRLDILAQEIQIDGPVVNEHESPLASLNLVAGPSKAELNAHHSVTDLFNDWYELEASQNTAASLPEYSIDITRPASLVAGSLSIMVTEDGAGVRLAGEAMATQYNFALTSTGIVEVEGQIIAAGNVEINSETFRVATTTDTQAKVESQQGAVIIDASKNIEVLGSLISAAIKDELNIKSQAAVSLYAGEDFLVSSLSDEEYQRGIVFSLADIHIEASKVFNQSGRLFANTGLSLNSTELYNSVLLPEFSGRGKIVEEEKDGKSLWYMAFLSKERIRRTYVNYGIPTTGNIASEIISNTGDVNINVEKFENIGGSITLNDGSLFVSADTVLNEAALIGKAELTITCSILGCNREGESDIEMLGGTWQASSDITINATSQIQNTGGTILAIQNLNLNSPDINSDSIQTYDVLTRNQGLRGLFLRDDALWVKADQGGALLANMGKIVISSTDSVDIDGGKIDAALGVDANVDVNIVREPTKTDLMIRKNGGLASEWF